MPTAAQMRAAYNRLYGKKKKKKSTGTKKKKATGGIGSYQRKIKNSPAVKAKAAKVRKKEAELAAAKREKAKAVKAAQKRYKKKS